MRVKRVKTGVRGLAPGKSLENAPFTEKMKLTEAKDHN